MPPSGKILTCAQVLAYIYIIVNFQLRSSIHAGLTERSLYNRFALKICQNGVFWGIFGEGAKIFGGNPPRNAMTADLRRLVKKLWRYYKYPSLYSRQRNYKNKKRNVYAVRVTFHPCAALSPLNPQLPRGACGVLWAT